MGAKVCLGACPAGPVKGHSQRAYAGGQQQHVTPEDKGGEEEVHPTRRGCVAHAVNDVAKVQKEMKPMLVEFMASPSLCYNPALLSLCPSIPQQSPPLLPCSLICFAVMKDDECILIILNQAVEIFNHHTLFPHLPSFSSFPAPCQTRQCCHSS